MYNKENKFNREKCFMFWIYLGIAYLFIVNEILSLDVLIGCCRYLLPIFLSREGYL